MSYSYCEQSDQEILTDILYREIPDQALADDSCWRRICQVRGRNFSRVDASTWREICRQRGHAKNAFVN